MIASLLPHEERFRLSSEGADIRSQKVPTFMAFRFRYKIFAMRYCKKRGHANLDGVPSCKRPLFWMIVAIAAARSVLHERAAFVTAWGSSERTLFCSFVFMLRLCMEPVSHLM